MKTAPALGAAKPKISDAVDVFLERNDTIADKAELMLKYVQELSASVDNSQLLQAEIAYMCFKGPQCPLLYHASTERWCSWEEYWRPACANLTRVKVYFQTNLLQTLRRVIELAVNRDIFPNTEDGEEHFRRAFLKKAAINLVATESCLKVIRECQSFFLQDGEFDMNAYILQLQNCVVDLRTDDFRRNQPSDLTSRC